MSFSVPSAFQYQAGRCSPLSLTDVAGGSVAVNAAVHDYFLLVGAGGAGSTRVLANPTGLVAGERRILTFEWQHAGTRLLTFDTLYQFGDAGAPSYPAAGVRDFISAIWNGSVLSCAYRQGYAT